MKRAILWLTLLTMGLAVPAAGMTELETLRERCAQQERQIRRLKAENERLREGKSDGSATTAHSTKEADSTKTTKTVSPKTETKADSPAKSTTSKTAKTAASGGSGGGTYTVRQGDSFDRIAHKNGTTAEKVAEANNLELTALIHPGQKLVLPAKGSSRSSSAHSTTHNADPPATRTPADPKPAKSPVADDSKPAKSPAKANPKPAKSPADTTDDPSVADEPPPAVPKSPATASAGRIPATRKTTATDTGTPADPPSATKTVDKKKTHAVKIENEMTYGEFAAKHGTDTKRLNDLNGLDLTKSAVLAKGSELYVPGQP